jgi:subtilisin-like proprotein convertase family protein
MKKQRLSVLTSCCALVVFGAFRLLAAVTESSTDVPKAIPDNSNVNSTLNFSVNGTITDANLTVNISHAWDADIQLSLSSPTVAAQILWRNCGSSGDNFTNTVIDDQAASLAPCTSAAGPPFAGSFKPTDGVNNAGTSPIAAPGTLAAFNGSLSGGTWTLNVADDSAVITGTLNSWSLTLDGTPPLPVELMKLEIS